MRIRYFAPLLFVAASVAQPPADPKPATIEGTIVNSVTGAPLRKADLTLANGEIPEAMAAMMKQVGGGSTDGAKATTKTLTATTDAAGKFRFENVPPGTYWLTGKKVGFADQPYKPKTAVGGDRGSIRLSAAQELKDVDFRLVPHGMASGRVLDEDGEPMPSAMVSALSYSFAQGQRRLVPADFGQTNSRGEFNLGKLPPGHYILCADVQRMGLPGAVAPPPADGSPETGYVGTYMPNTTDAAQAQKVDIAPGGEVTGLSIHVQKSRVVRVKGRLTDNTGQPIKSAQIMIMAGGGRVGSMSMTTVNDHVPLRPGWCVPQISGV